MASGHYWARHAAASLLQAIEEHRPRLVWLSITSTAFARSSLTRTRLFKLAQSRGTRVALGGQGVTAELQDRLVASTFGTRLAHLRAFASSLT